MRRVLGVVGLVGLGLILGFIITSLRPRPNAGATVVNAERRT